MFRIEPHALGDTLDSLIGTAVSGAHAAANAPSPVVFCPPVATFHNPRKADEASLANGLALSVECDAAPDAARIRLETVLGPATLVVASGGEWSDPVTSEIQPKLHLHWRLAEPTREAADHALLKQARQLAQRLVGGDPSNVPLVHPIRWPGSWHRKSTPRLAQIVALDDGHEVHLQDALERLQEAAIAVKPGDWADTSECQAPGAGEARETSELVRVVLTAENYHTPLAALAMRYLKGGMADAQAVHTLRGFMLAVPASERDRADRGAQPGRWQARYNDVPRAVSTARVKLGEPAATAKSNPVDLWPDPVNFLADTELTGAPKLRPEHLPDALAPFVFDTAARMGLYSWSSVERPSGPPKTIFAWPLAAFRFFGLGTGVTRSDLRRLSVVS